MTEAIIFGGNDNHVFDENLRSISTGEDFDHEKVASKYGVVLLMQGTSHDELVALAKDLPTDTHLVTFYWNDSPDVLEYDAVRAYKKSDIFDYYADQPKAFVTAIESGFGSIKPKLFQDTKKAS